LFGRQPVVVTQLLACLNIPCRHNPNGPLGDDSFAVRFTGVVDVASRIFQRLPIDIIAVIEGKNVGVALRESLGTVLFGDFLTDILDNA
jgi:hypothetical protein